MLVDVSGLLEQIQEIRRKAREDENKLRESIYSMATQFESYWELCSFVHDNTSSLEEYNRVMLIARPIFLDKQWDVVKR